MGEVKIIDGWQVGDETRVRTTGGGYSSITNITCTTCGKVRSVKTVWVNAEDLKPCNHVRNYMPATGW